MKRRFHSPGWGRICALNGLNVEMNIIERAAMADARKCVTLLKDRVILGNLIKVPHERKVVAS
jgi:hypothetical protein